MSIIAEFAIILISFFTFYYLVGEWNKLVEEDNSKRNLV